MGRERSAPDRRRVRDRLEQQQQKAARDLARWSDKALPPIQRRIAAAWAKTREMMETGDWSQSEPIHFLALHRQQHVQVYGATPVLTPKMVFSIATAVREHFSGDAQEFALFMHWVWEQEKDRVRKLRANNVQLTMGLTIRRLLSEDILTGYRTYVVNRIAEGDIDEDEENSD